MKRRYLRWPLKKEGLSNRPKCQGKTFYRNLKGKGKHGVISWNYVKVFLKIETISLGEDRETKEKASWKYIFGEP